jgi:hypothetical protein
MNERLRKFVHERAKGCCEYCMSPVEYSSDPFSIEHIIPRSKGGSDEENNLAFSCQGCNGRKYNYILAIDPLTDILTPLFHPREDVWSDHFIWNESFTQLIALTPTGRATIERLQLNRRAVVNLRKLLVMVGAHPPQ